MTIAPVPQIPIGLATCGVGWACTSGLGSVHSPPMLPSAEAAAEDSEGDTGLSSASRNNTGGNHLFPFDQSGMPQSGSVCRGSETPWWLCHAAH